MYPSTCICSLHHSLKCGESNTMESVLNTDASDCALALYHLKGIDGGAEMFIKEAVTEDI